MFTGIVTEVGEVEQAQFGDADGVIAISAPRTCESLALGDSVAVAGVCLTATDVTDGVFRADVMRETVRATRIGRLRAGDAVNLERALPAAGRLDGHIVQGHVDGVARVASQVPGRAWLDVGFDCNEGLARYIAVKGSIAIDGVSLTVTMVRDAADGGPAGFGVSLIPTTLKATTLGWLQTGDEVNVEVDVLAKYVERLLATGAGPAPAGTASIPAADTTPAPAAGTAPVSAAGTTPGPDTSATPRPVSSTTSPTEGGHR